MSDVTPIRDPKTDPLLTPQNAVLARLVSIDDGHLFLVASARESAAIVSEFLR